MKIVSINSLPNGSTGRIMCEIADMSRKDGFDAYCYWGSWYFEIKEINVKYGRFGSSIENKISAVFSILTGLQNFGSIIGTISLIKKIKKIDPDIIHLHNLHLWTINLPMLFKYIKKHNIKTVWTLHDCWAFTGGCPHFEALGCDKWKTGCFQCQQTTRFQLDHSRQNFELKKKLLQALGSRLTIVCVSEWLAQYVRQSFLGSCSINIINNGIDLSTFTPKETAGKRRMILGVSNVWPDYKGLPDFIHLHDILPKNIEMVLVGLSKNQIKNLPKGISGRERTSNIEELVNLYRSAMAFVNPTYNDSFPTVNLEALACGTPVITYRTGGSPEAVDEKTGIVIEKGDIDALANSIKSIASESIKFNSDLCRQRAVENFNQKTQFNKYIDLYESLLSKKQ